MSIIRRIDELLAEAVRARASDLHFLPTAGRLRVRLRIDGRLEEREALPKAAEAEIISRLKIMAGLRTDEHQAAQDGRFRIDLADAGRFDVRISTLPTQHGENAVLRLLPERPIAADLEGLGFPPECRERAMRALRAPHGLVLAVGATGSGKTTTLYALAASLDAKAAALTTVEDPVEYALEDASQIPVNGRGGLTFATGLRAVLRQDPDVILVGEIRDAETAALAAGAALTGHLVLSTLHASDAATALPRLLDLKVEPYLTAAAASLVIGQRLVRKICERCRRECAPSAAERARLAGLSSTAIRCFRGRGCEACRGTGYHGRIGLYETLAVDEAVRDAVLRRASAEEIRAIAGTPSMLEDGLTKVGAGLTSVEEVLRTQP